ncbi:hypothetical protein H4684_004140 [Desulfomicrobium macestii]|uniref:Uncharacterized protein n=1 Tax=Desulfomicrobium macestii TaxID=90731 RepID=A0ABR9H9R9_9BACT|nr:hypothetical protein [Desulfomicrobium macestii]MBE1427443.1 hypothetical protein [Desulfomicrobium macestii]
MKCESKQIIELVSGNIGHFDMTAQVKAKESFHLLKKILADRKMQKSMARHYRMLNKGYYDPGEFPSWAYSLSYCLVDPDYKYSLEIKNSIVEICNEMISDFKSKDKDYIHFVMEADESPKFLKHMAKDMCHMQI